MNAITPTLTTAGIQAVFNATNTGLQAEVTHIALGDSGYTPTEAATALVAEKQRVAVSGGELIGTNQIHLTASASGASEYWIREVGFYLSDGTLLAVYSHPTNAIAHKSSALDILLSFDLLLSALPASSISINGTGGLSFPAATNAKQGILRFATDVEALAGTLNTAATTPQHLAALLPAGIIAPYAAAPLPQGWLLCDGALLSRTAYANLFAIIGTIYGIGDGSTTFALPDLRGEFLRALDNERGIDSGRNLGSYQADAFKSHRHGIPEAAPNDAKDGLGIDSGDLQNTLNSFTLSEGGSETRPRNVAVNFIVKY